MSRQWLAENFGQRVISNKTPFEWAPYSPDLNPLDFFLWGYLKDSVYREGPTTLDELKQSIAYHIQQVNQDADLCQRVIDNFKKRLVVCRRRRGGHIEHVI